MRAGHPATPIAVIVFPAAAVALAAGLAVAGDWLDGTPTWASPLAPLLATGLLIGCVFAALWYAEVVAHRLGEPLGTLALTLSVTSIEVTIVASMMLNEANNPTLAREAIFSVVMIVCTGIVGLCLLLGGLRYGGQDFRPRGTSAFLAVLMALSVLTLILPNYTLSTDGPTFSTAQLVFVSANAALLYGAFLFAQTVRHRNDFAEMDAKSHRRSGPFPSDRRMLGCAMGLLASLAGVILLSERVAEWIEHGFQASGLSRPDALIGAAVALMVLMPEALAAVRAAARNALQTSLNVALGSAVATIGLTIPAVAIVSLVTGRELILGLGPRDTVLLLLTLVTTIVSFGTGRTNMLAGLVHLVIFGTYVFLLVVP